MNDLFEVCFVQLLILILVYSTLLSGKVRTAWLFIYSQTALTSAGKKIGKLYENIP